MTMYPPMTTKKLCLTVQDSSPLPRRCLVRVTAVRSSVKAIPAMYSGASMATSMSLNLYQRRQLVGLRYGGTCRWSAVHVEMKMVEAQPHTRSMVDRRLGAEYQPTWIGSDMSLLLSFLSSAPDYIKARRRYLKSLEYLFNSCTDQAARVPF